MWYQTHDNLITFNNVLGPPETKSPSNILYTATQLPPDFVLRSPNLLLKVIKLFRVWHHTVSSTRGSVKDPLFAVSPSMSYLFICLICPWYNTVRVHSLFPPSPLFHLWSCRLVELSSCVVEETEKELDNWLENTTGERHNDMLMFNKQCQQTKAFETFTLCASYSSQSNLTFLILLSSDEMDVRVQYTPQCYM